MPFAVENYSSFPHFAFVKTAPDGVLHHVLAVRATFDWVPDGEMTVAREQEPVVVADQWDGEPGKGDFRFETDLVIGKPRADIHVIGDAHAAAGEPRADWDVAIRVGDALTKTLHVTGPRYWEHGAFGYSLTVPKPVASVPLSYRLAYGGTRVRGDEKDTFTQNPIGVGYKGRFPIEEALWPAPQIESLDAPIRSLSDQPAPEGLGPIARWWLPRRARCGTLTEAFVRQNPGKLPPDFDWEFYNSAHPGLMAKGFLIGDEQIATIGLFPEGRSISRLPGARAQVILLLGGKLPLAAAPHLDTLTIDTKARKVYATWRINVGTYLDLTKVVLGFASPRPLRTTAEPDAIEPEKKPLQSVERSA